MSGFLFSLRSLPSGAVDRAATAFANVPGTWTAPVADGPLAGVAVRSDREDLWGPATDPATGVTVWLGGRAALDERQWEAAEALPYRGGLACRHALGEYLQTPDAFPARQNGAFAFTIWDPRDRSLHVAMDRMGFFPVYVWGEGERPAVATHPDVLAETVGGATLDLGTMAEVLARGQALPPRTYYEEVRELEPGTVYTWRGGEPVRRRAYWAPEYRVDPAVGADALGEELAAAITAAVRRRTLPHLGSSALMLSGGADSRVVLYAACDPASVTSVTLYSEPNAELATARALAERAGSPHVALQRTFEHYGEGAPEAVRVTGGMWNVLDAHYTALVPQIDALGAETVLTGCYADYLFKGLTSNRRRRTLFRRDLPLYEFAPFSDRWYVPAGRVGERWRGVVHDRVAARHTGLDLEDASDEARWRVELRRIRPVVREADTASRLLLHRALRWDPFFADDALVDVYQRVPPSLKLNGQVWERAVARICRAAGDVPNNNSQSPIGASETRKVLHFLYGVAYRKVRRRDLDGTPLGGGHSRGSWPDFGHYVRYSTVVPELWAEREPETSEVLADLLGEDLGGRSALEWAQRLGAHAFFRTLTLKLWLDTRVGHPGIVREGPGARSPSVPA